MRLQAGRNRGPKRRVSGSVGGSDEDLPCGKVVLVWTVVGPADGKIGAGIFATMHESQRYAGTGADAGRGEEPAIVLQSETNNGSAAYASIAQIGSS